MSNLIEEVLQTKDAIQPMALCRPARRKDDGSDSRSLTAAIAHGRNQPLTGILTHASIRVRMLDSKMPDLDVARKAAGRTIRDVRRAVETIDRLRAHFAKRELAADSVDLNDMALAVLADSRPGLERARITVRCDLAHDLPRLVGDGMQLQQVVSNLVKSAIEAMHGIGDRRLVLTVTTRWYGDDRVMLGVRDGGAGIAPRDLDRLFDPFYTTKNDSMGASLCISRAIVERHGGQLWATCNDGPGAAFWLSLPIAPESTPSSSPTARTFASRSARPEVMNHGYPSRRGTDEWSAQ